MLDSEKVLETSGPALSVIYGADAIWQWWGRHGEFLVTELKILLITFFILYVSSHATLHRPASAKPCKKRASSNDIGKEGEYENGRSIGSLQPSDAIVFPLIASTALVGMYCIIQFLRRPEMLNMMMRIYTSTASIGSLLVFYSHALRLATSFVFPRAWRDSHGIIYWVSQRARCHHIWNESYVAKGENGKQMPFGPLPLRLAAARLPIVLQSRLWDFRALLTQGWFLEFKLHGLFDEKAHLCFHHGLAALMAMVTIIAYNLTNSSFLSNIMGLAFCYATQQLLSPTTFTTGFLVLIGLFVYDIVMVFYTYVTQTYLPCLPSTRPLLTVVF